MKAFKGFNKDMTCRGFQFEEGKTYHEEEAELCRSGFHACEDPLDCFKCYEPVESVYHEVELDEISNKKITGNSMICGKTIKIGAKLDIAAICKAHFEYIKSKTKNYKKAQDCSALAAQDHSALEAQDDSSLAAQSSSSLVARDCSVLAAQSWSVLVGRSCSTLAAQDYSALVARNCSALAAQYYSALVGRSCSTLAAQDHSALEAQDESVLAARDDSTLAAGRNSIIAAFNSKVKGKKGTLIALANRVYDDEAREWIISDFKAGIVDGKIIKEDTWYTVKNGEFVEVEADE